MITKFRLEGTHQDKDQLIEQLNSAALRVIELAKRERGISEANEPDGEWECVDDFIQGKPGNYKGRMTFVYDEAEVGEFSFGKAKPILPGR